MKHNSKRFLSLLLALVMVIGLMPMSHAHAEDATLQMISEQVTSVEENANYVIALAGTKKALTNGDGRTDWGITRCSCPTSAYAPMPPTSGPWRAPRAASS